VNAPPDQVLTAKKEFIEKNGLVVWRFSDHWRLRKPGPLIQGLSETMGWTKNQASGDPSHFALQAISLDELARTRRAGVVVPTAISIAPAIAEARRARLIIVVLPNFSVATGTFPARPLPMPALAAENTSRCGRRPEQMLLARQRQLLPWNRGSLASTAKNG